MIRPGTLVPTELDPLIRKIIAEKKGILGIDIACYDLNYDSIEATLKANPSEKIHEHIPLKDKRIVEIALKHQPDVLSKCVLLADTPIDQVLWLLAQGANPNLIDDHFRETPQQWVHRFKQKD